MRMPITPVSWKNSHTGRESMIDLQKREGGICLPVKVQPGARRNAIVGEHAGALKLAVHAAPENGKANASVIQLLAEQLALPRSNIQLISGATNRQKQFLVSGIELEELRTRLSTCICSAKSPQG